MKKIRIVSPVYKGLIPLKKCDLLALTIVKNSRNNNKFPGGPLKICFLYPNRLAVMPNTSLCL